MESSLIGVELGHNDVTSSSETTYKNIKTREIINSIQSGIEHVINGSTSEIDRDLLIQDFMTLETSTIPSKGPYNSSFKFKNYAPVAFRHFGDLFGIKMENYLHSMCSSPLRELPSPGGSNSAFYLTYDDAFIVKTISKTEGEFLLKLLPGYYLNLTQNPRTLLPKFFGFYSINRNGKRIHLVTMNNVIPSNIRINQRYDLKGSTHRRKLNPIEAAKPSPTYKDLDFLQHHPGGLHLDSETYNMLSETLKRDCRVLESFDIIDYSLLLAVHYSGPTPKRPKNKGRVSGVPATTINGERLILFMGIIDTLQCYQIRKKIEHAWKSLIYKSDSISVHRPDTYSSRFRKFIMTSVFRKITKRKMEALQPIEEESAVSNSILRLTWTPHNMLTPYNEDLNEDETKSVPIVN